MRKPSELDLLFRRAVADGTFSGASLLVRAASVGDIFFRSWGRTRKDGETVHAGTRFDLASLTKPLVTSPLCMWAVDRAEFGLEDPISRFFSRSQVPHDKRSITVRQLLNHRSGLPAYKPFYFKLLDVEGRNDKKTLLLSLLLSAPLVHPPGKAACYSDLGYMLLGLILERTLGAPLDILADRILFQPFGVEDLHFQPLSVSPDPTVSPAIRSAGILSFAATEICPWRNRCLQGEVHDENAYSLGGVAGHAGLFGTARGIFLLLSRLWEIRSGRVQYPEWSAEVIDTFWTRSNDAECSTWALGYDTPSPENSSSGRYFSSSTIGHLGFSGTSFWLDPDKKILIILLTNRIYPTRHNERLKAFRPLVHDFIMEALHAESLF